MVEFTDNPHHRRSRLVRITAKGEARYRDLSGRIGGLAERLATGASERELRSAAAVLRLLREKLGQ
ncbi:MAG: hypothetical protein ACREGL_03890 [Alphaproteobacteria bacterium]